MHLVEPQSCPIRSPGRLRFLLFQNPLGRILDALVFPPNFFPPTFLYYSAYTVSTISYHRPKSVEGVGPVTFLVCFFLRKCVGTFKKK